MKPGWVRPTQDGGEMLEIKEVITDEIVSMCIITQEDLRFIH